MEFGSTIAILFRQLGNDCREPRRRFILEVGGATQSRSRAPRRRGWQRAPSFGHLESRVSRPLAKIRQGMK